MKSKGESLKPIQINGHPYVGTKSGFFHRWCIEPNYESEVPYTRTLALIELNDGRVKYIEPEYLKFTEPYKP
jgi:hypothetical protein